MRNIHNQNLAELAHYIIVFNMQELGRCFGDTEISVWTFEDIHFHFLLPDKELERNLPTSSTNICVK